MKRAFTVKVERVSPGGTVSRCRYTFSSEDSADRFVEDVTGFDIGYVGIIYGQRAEKMDSEGNVWSILYDQPTVLDPDEFELEGVTAVDHI